MGYQLRFAALVPSEREFVEESLNAFSERLLGKYPFFPTVKLRELSNIDRERVGHYLTLQIVDASGLRGDSFDSRKLLVFCESEHEMARSIRQKYPLAKWGGARMGRFAVTWKASCRFVLWHEAMHLLWADDCYNESGQINCDKPNCLMQWEPCEVNCAGDLLLCEKNVNRVQVFAEQNAEPEWTTSKPSP